MNQPAPQRAEAQIHSTPLEDKEIRKRLLKAIDTSSGRVTASDLVVSSGLPPTDVERVLRDIVMRYDCRIEPDEAGRIVYDFGPSPSLRERERDPWWEKLKRWSWKAFKAVFKVSITVVLVGYVVFFVLLIIAMMVAAASRDSDSDISFGNNRGGGGSFWFWYWVFGRDSHARHRTSPYAHRYASDRHYEEKDDRPFYKKVYAFVFGPEYDETDLLEDEQQILAWIRTEGGVIAPTELAARTGWSIEAAEKESTRLLALYDGSVEIMNDGTTVYRFNELMHSESHADGRIAPPFWSHWEAREPVTGNKGGTNFGIGALNTFVLVMAGLLASGIGAELLSGAGIGMALFPLVYSLLFFSVPAMRALFSVRPENKRRKERNVRRAVMRHVFAYSEGTPARIYPEEAVPLIARKVASSAIAPDKLDQAIEEELARMAAEYGAVTDIDEDGKTWHRFDRIADEKNAAIAVRNGETATGEKHWFDADLADFEARLAEAGVSDSEPGELPMSSYSAEADEPVYVESVPSDEEWEERLKG